MSALNGYQYLEPRQRSRARVGIPIALQVYVIPPQCTRLFGSDAYQETQHNVGIHAVGPCRPDQGNGLPECERL